jgi:hypothetical protein
MTLVRTAILTAAGLWLLAPASAAPLRGRQNGSKQPATVMLKFPQVAGCTREKPHDYGIPELGYSVGYISTDGVTATIYVYSGGQQRVPDGPSSTLVKQEFETALSDIRAMQEEGRYKDLSERSHGEMRLGKAKGAPLVRYSIMTVTNPKGKVVTELYMTGYKNQFVKVRVTRPRATEAKTKATRDRLFDKLGAAMR